MNRVFDRNCNDNIDSDVFVIMKTTSERDSRDVYSARIHIQRRCHILHKLRLIKRARIHRHRQFNDGIERFPRNQRRIRRRRGRHRQRRRGNGCGTIAMIRNAVVEGCIIWTDLGLQVVCQHHPNVIVGDCIAHNKLKGSKRIVQVRRM
jgi:hypothetical protein